MQNKGNHFKLLAKVRAQQKKNYFHNNETMNNGVGGRLIACKI